MSPIQNFKDVLVLMLLIFASTLISIWCFTVISLQYSPTVMFGLARSVLNNVRNHPRNTCSDDTEKQLLHFQSLTKAYEMLLSEANANIEIMRKDYVKLEEDNLQLMQNLTACRREKERIKVELVSMNETVKKLMETKQVLEKKSTEAKRENKEMAKKLSAVNNITDKMRKGVEDQKERIKNKKDKEQLEDAIIACEKENKKNKLDLILLKENTKDLIKINQDLEKNLTVSKIENKEMENKLSTAIDKMKKDGEEEGKIRRKLEQDNKQVKQSLTACEREKQQTEDTLLKESTLLKDNVTKCMKIKQDLDNNLTECNNKNSEIANKLSTAEKTIEKYDKMKIDLKLCQDKHFKIQEKLEELKRDL